jgi:RND family efflux transporter MFP subunit
MPSLFFRNLFCRKKTVAIAGAIVVLSASMLSGCNKNAQASGEQAPQALPVKIQLAQVKRVPDYTEYLATLRSRNSSVLQPQVEGQITKIFVKSGERVSTGTPLIEIDPLKQQATVYNQEANQRSKLATLDYDRRDLERRKKLFAAGVISQQDLDQADSAYRAAKADVDAMEAGVREQRVQLHYYTVKAPASGIIGDIPVRVGDRVTVSTVLTTLDKSGELEAYISVPSEKASAVRMGTPVDVFTEDSQPVRSRVSFISPRVDPDSQLLLIKAMVPNDGSRFRNSQVVRSRVIWRELDQPVIPVTAISRLGSQTFAFVAEGDQGKTVAKQLTVKLGELVDNDYVVMDGIKPGDRVIVSGVQILVDGMPVAPQS